MSNLLNQLQQKLTSVEADYSKALSGNVAAGTRFRAVMQEVREMAVALRNQVLEVRKAKKAGKSS